MFKENKPVDLKIPPHPRHLAQLPSSGVYFSQLTIYRTDEVYRAQELCESLGRRPGLLVPTSSPYGLCGHKATLNLD